METLFQDDRAEYAQKHLHARQIVARMARLIYDLDALGIPMSPVDKVGEHVHELAACAGLVHGGLSRRLEFVPGWKLDEKGEAVNAHEKTGKLDHQTD